MNSANIILALTVASAVFGLICARPPRDEGNNNNVEVSNNGNNDANDNHHPRQIQREDIDFNEQPFHRGQLHPQVGHGQIHRNPLNFFNTEVLFNELRRRGFLVGANQQVLRPRNSGKPRSGLRERRPTRFNNGAGVGNVGLGAAGAGRFDSSKNAEAGIASSTQLGQHGSIEGHKGSSLVDDKRFNALNREEVHDDDEATHQHQVVGTDKTIIQDKTFGVNDRDTIRKNVGASKTNFVGASNQNVLAHGESGRIEEGAHANNDNAAFVRGSSDIGAGVSGGIGHNVNDVEA